MYVKDQFIGVLENLNESQIEHLLNYVKGTFSPKSKGWDDIEEDDPTEDEVAAYKRFVALKPEVYITNYGLELINESDAEAKWRFDAIIIVTRRAALWKPRRTSIRRLFK